MILGTTSVRAVHREVIMLLLRPSERKRGTDEAVLMLQRSGQIADHHCTFGEAALLRLKAKIMTTPPVFTGTRSLLKPQREAASTMLGVKNLVLMARGDQ